MDVQGHALVQTGRVTDAEPAVRIFTPADWSAVCDLYEPAARLELKLSGTDPRAFRPMSDEEDLDTFLQLNSALVACLNGRVVGFVAWRDRGDWRRSGYLSWLYVDPAYHRRGIGERLLGMAMDSLGDQAWTLAKQGNDPAIRLYRRHGMPRRARRKPGGTRTPRSGWPCPRVERTTRTLRTAAPDGSQGPGLAGFVTVDRRAGGPRLIR